MSTIRRCRFWRRAPARPSPDGCGCSAPPLPQRRLLAKFRGFLQADGYSGFGALYETANGQSATMTEIACWAHVRRKFYDIHVATNAPIAADALTRIGQLFQRRRRSTEVITSTVAICLL
jgi:hypothetical protein